MMLQSLYLIKKSSSIISHESALKLEMKYTCQQKLAFASTCWHMPTKATFWKLENVGYDS